MPLALFGISSSGLEIFVDLLVLFLVVVYFALIYWVYLDAKRRLEDPVLIACSVAAAFFPFVGPIVYTILRPPEFLDDVHERDLEIRASELRVRQLIEQSCPHCEYPIELDYLRCPNCERKLKQPCRSCHKPLDPKWGVCPYCETEVRKPKAAQEEPRRTSRRDRQRRTQEQRAARPAPAPAGQRPASPPSPPQGGNQRQPERTATRPNTSSSTQPAPRGSGEGQQDPATDPRSPRPR